MGKAPINQTHKTEKNAYTRLYISCILYTRNPLLRLGVCIVVLQKVNREKGEDRMETGFDFFGAALPGITVGLAIGSCIKKENQEKDNDEK